MLPSLTSPGWLVHLLLGLSLLLLAGCEEHSGTSGRGVPGWVGSGADPGRGAFEGIPLPKTDTDGGDPGALAREIFGAREPVEGHYSEAVETLAASAEGQVVLFTQMDLPDDSLRGVRHRLEFTPQDGQWQLAWVGRQVLCRPGRGHEDWGTAPCL